MTPVDLLKWFFLLFMAGPVVAALLAFRGPPGLRGPARWFLFGACLANAAATIACVSLATRTSSSGIGNGVFYLMAIPPAFLTVLWWGVWRGIARFEYLETLAPDLRRAEELEDIERSLEQARSSLAQAERKVEGWLVSGEERDRLRFEIGTLRSLIANLEQQRKARIPRTVPVA